MLQGSAQGWAAACPGSSTPETARRNRHPTDVPTSNWRNLMAGHSKWSNIKHRKAAQDAKRGKIFTKIIRELTVAAKSGPLPEDNPRLQAAVDKARSEEHTSELQSRG